MTAAALPERGYGHVGAEDLSDDLDEVIQDWLDWYDGDPNRTEIEEHSVLPRITHFPSPDLVLEWINEWVAENGMVGENFEVDGSAVSVSAMAECLQTVADNCHGWMADKVLRTHVLEVRGLQPFLNGEPWGPELPEVPA